MSERPSETTEAGTRHGESDAADPGAYIGHEPEPASETIPGGVGPRDERVAAVATQSTGVGRPDQRGQPADEPGGHRFGTAVSDDDVRRAGDGTG